ncbi:MAG: TIM barrel protein [Dehalococcoidia bacterium]|nr:TIM barrel protein [Dehalococcoidia bacterium]
MVQISLSTMWAKDRFANLAEFVAKARQLGFTHVEANATVSPRGLEELLQTGFPISSIHSPCPAVSSSRGIPTANLSLSSLDRSEQEEAIDHAAKTIDLASKVGANAVVLHMGELPIALRLEDELRQLYRQNLAKTTTYSELREQLSHQRACEAPPYLEQAKKSLQRLSEYAEHRAVLLGLETRVHFSEIPSIKEMSELLGETRRESVGYWHDVGHAEMQQRLGFVPHEAWFSQFECEMIGVHLHDVLGISDHRPPGKGDVNWEMIVKNLPPQAIRVCEIAEWNEESDIQGVVSFLKKTGIL